ncbi:MAG: hypothetical protein C4518_02790 [Desulfobacteraceae bacterium]|nr:MAG: hypothetical protein C4518_02790 [Desulfobacteraceae bacterium]
MKINQNGERPSIQLYNRMATAYQQTAILVRGVFRLENHWQKLQSFLVEVIASVSGEGTESTERLCVCRAWHMFLKVSRI